MKILAIGDSLALPGHGNSYEDTWIYKLKQSYTGYDFITYFRRQLTTDVLVSMGGGFHGPDKLPKGADCLEFFKPDIVILQLGIVDCAPRLLYEFERKIIGQLPQNILERYLYIVKKLRERNLNNTFVSPEKFTTNLREYLHRCAVLEVKKVIYIGICYPDNTMIEKNPTIGESVNYFNKIILQLADEYNFLKPIFPLDSRNKQGIYSDGYNPNQKGHSVILNELINIMDVQKHFS